MNLLHTFKLDSDRRLAKHFMPHQLGWIQAEAAIHKQRQQVVALAEKSVRIGWTYADGFKNVRKRLWFKNRDYLFATKDYPSALEYIRQCYQFAEIFNLTRSIISHGEESIALNRLDDAGRPSSFTEDVKIGVIKFDNGSRIIAFSANPQAMAVYGGDVGLDEFAKHPNARLLWETAQGRVTWNYDLAIWSAHDGEDTLFNEFAREARAAWLSGRALNPLAKLLQQHEDGLVDNWINGFLGSNTPTSDVPSAPSLPSPAPTPLDANAKPATRLPSIDPSIHPSTHPQIQPSVNPASPWNLYFRVTMPDAIHLGLVETINRARKTSISPKQFLDDCRARARDEGIFEQTYLCNPLGASTNHIVEWSAIERCRADYEIDRVHLEADEVRRHFGEFVYADQGPRERKIHSFLRENFASLFGANSLFHQPAPDSKLKNLRLGFDVAASGKGDLACIYIDQANGDQLHLRALFTCRTEDWHFLKTVLCFFLREFRDLQAAGDESGLGRQICWQAAAEFHSRFLKVNFGSKKHDLGFALMNQLSTSGKRFPKSGHDDIAADYFALQKAYTGTKWAFSEGRNSLNAASHCDIAWAGALASYAHAEEPQGLGACVGLEDGSVWHSDGHITPPPTPTPAQKARRLHELM